MPSSRSSAARSTPARPAVTPRQRPAAGFKPRRVRNRAPLSRIRWDRASRVALITVLAIIAALWISGITSLLRHHAQAAAGLSQVQRLAAQNHTLEAEIRALHQRGTILDHARALGMVKKGEQAFIVTH